MNPLPTPEQAAPEGWKLVPLEPTLEMCRAALDCQEYDPIDPPEAEVFALYQAMLSASPLPSPQMEPGTPKPDSVHLASDCVTPESLARMKCWCHICRPLGPDRMEMIVCPDCGCKRCPHAEHHEADCTGKTGREVVDGHTCSGCRANRAMWEARLSQAPPDSPPTGDQQKDKTKGAVPSLVKERTE
jgi:hypothetical protein